MFSFVCRFFTYNSDDDAGLHFIFGRTVRSKAERQRGRGEEGREVESREAEMQRGRNAERQRRREVGGRVRFRPRGGRSFGGDVFITVVL